MKQGLVKSDLQVVDTTETDNNSPKNLKFIKNTGMYFFTPVFFDGQVKVCNG